MPVVYKVHHRFQKNHKPVSYLINQNAEASGFFDLYLPKQEIWIYDMETGKWYIFVY